MIQECSQLTRLFSCDIAMHLAYISISLK